MSSEKVPTDAAELVTAFNSLPRPAALPIPSEKSSSSSNIVEVVPNAYVMSVQTMRVEGSDTRVLWIFQPHTQAAHIEALPPPSTPSSSTSAGTHSDDAPKRQEEQQQQQDDDAKAGGGSNGDAGALSAVAARVAAPSVALALLKAFAGGFGKRRFGPGMPEAEDQGARAPYMLRLPRSQISLAAPVRHVLNLIKVQVPPVHGDRADTTPMGPVDDPAAPAEEKLAQAAWNQFAIAIQRAAASQK